MQNTGYLSELNCGESAFVSDICLDGGMRERLQALGLVRGTVVTCVRRSPLGDPAAFLIRGTVIALRYEDSSRIQIQRGRIWA